jgi:uncharacterized cupin superfamily protein
MALIDMETVPVRTTSIYPAPFDGWMTGRRSLQLGRAGGLTQFGVNITILPPGARSSLRHWHLNEDEFVMVLEGELTLVTDAGEHLMRAGDCAAFPAGQPEGHTLVNRSAAEGRFLVVGTRAPHEVCTYTDVDLKVEMQGGEARFSRRDGTPYIPPQEEETA